ncbi:uncharacterized protein JN550_003891 [Neoarthrinium moseri]|uniref:uncharacterized protein n=1 Tax=Neoarthrinium moseri TaxID=1658444 RepID=UPI001FDD5A90|nr:uncharacterized protein JN550_003891 [Neoarthrinium moseri]KAI1872172.1 hypothetical protein JN550_003891 [Neoarthrinium moseri]
MAGESTSTYPQASQAPRKRKLSANYDGPGPSASNTTGASADALVGSQEYKQVAGEKPKKPRRSRGQDEEKRLRRFRPKPPQSFNEIYHRATSQRFYVLNRSRCGTAKCPEERVELTGSTGNIYTVHISRRPSCNCPHAEQGNQCKHMLYVMSRVLRARYELVYQLALLSTELVEIIAGAPPIEVGDDAEKPKEDKNRKAVEGDCPICFMPFEDTEATVYCRATCGQNMHKQCFEMWAATKSRDSVTCPMCRTKWQGDDDMVKKIRNTGVVGRDGYVNVADQLGISRIQVHITLDDVEVMGTTDRGLTMELITSSKPYECAVAILISIKNS